MRSLIWLKLIFITAVFAFATSICAQDDPGFGSRGGAKNVPISSVLNSDGSVKQGSSGSFDPKGFRMITGSDGAPRFIPESAATSGSYFSLSTATDCNDGWDDRFGTTNGFYGGVDAVAVSGSDIYVGGTFALARGNNMIGIAKWNGTSWSVLGSGTNGGVYTIAVSGSDVYIGGEFSLAGGIPANGIAKWNGSSWSALGSGVSAYGAYGAGVYAISVSGSDILVAGAIESAGGVVGTSGIAKWDGSNWVSLGGGIPVSTYQLCDDGDRGTPQCYDFYAEHPTVIAVSDGDVYVGGWFGSAAGVPVNNIAKWDGSSWSALGSGVTGGYADGVNAIAVSGSNVYVGGRFASAGGATGTRGIAKWNGTSWSALGSGTNGAVYAIAVSGSDVYIGGQFTSTGGVSANNIAKWNGSSWSALGSGVAGNDVYPPLVAAISISGSDLYAGGVFSTAGCHAASNYSIYHSLTRSATHLTPSDFDGDGKADLAVFRPSDSVWYLNRSTEGFGAVQFGLSTDKIVPADYDGDGKTDIAIFRDGEWWILSSSRSEPERIHFGQTGDIPVPADYTGDGKAELAVYRNGIWWMFDLGTGQTSVLSFGLSTDKPVVADYDGDGKADQAVYRNGEWHLNLSTTGYGVIQFGLATDKPLIEDFDGDGKADPAVYRDGIWYALQSSKGFIAFQFGLPSDVTVPADYDGDGKTDAAIYRNGQWWIKRSSSDVITVDSFGVSDDRPIPSAYLR